MKQRSLYIFYYLKHLHHRARAKFTHSYNDLSAPFLGKRPPSDEEEKRFDQALSDEQ